MDVRHDIAEVASLFQRTVRGVRDRGASLVEYALLVALISVMCLGAIRAFGQENGGLIEGSADEIVNASGS